MLLTPFCQDWSWFNSNLNLTNPIDFMDGSLTLSNLDSAHFGFDSDDGVVTLCLACS